MHVSQTDPSAQIYTHILPHFKNSKSIVLLDFTHHHVCPSNSDIRLWPHLRQFMNTQNIHNRDATIFPTVRSTDGDLLASKINWWRNLYNLEAPGCNMKRHHIWCVHRAVLLLSMSNTISNVYLMQKHSLNLTYESNAYNILDIHLLGALPSYMYCHTRIWICISLFVPVASYPYPHTHETRNVCACMLLCNGQIYVYSCSDTCSLLAETAIQTQFTFPHTSTCEIYIRVASMWRASFQECIIRTYTIALGSNVLVQKSFGSSYTASMTGCIPNLRSSARATSLISASGDCALLISGFMRFSERACSHCACIQS